MKGKTTFLARASMMLLAVLLSLTGARAQAKDLPYEYGFENNDLAAEGWTTVSVGTSNNSSFGITSTAKTGDYGFRFSSYYQDNTSYDQYLISPELNATNGVIVQFQYKASSSTNSESFKVGYSQTDTNIESFTFGDEITTSGNAWTQSEEFIFPEGTKYVAVYYFSNYKFYLYLDDFVFSVPSSATKPETLEVSGITDSKAVLTWTGGNGTYNVEYKKASETDWTVAVTGTTEYTYTLSGLTSGTAYEARVQSVNGSDVSSWKTVSFSTVIVFPYFQDFAAGLLSDWTIYTGLVEEVLSGTATLKASTARWKVGTDNGVLDGNHALANIYGTGTQHWLVTPEIPVEANAQLAFDVAYTKYSGEAVNPDASGTDDKFVVLISTDGMATWTILRQWDNAGSEFVLNDFGPTKTSVSIDLSAYAGQNVCVAFYVESTASNADNNLHIDDVSIDLKPAVETPYGLKISYDGGTEATVSWASIEDAWDIDVNGVVTEDVDNPFTLTGLEYATTYTIKVRAKKGTEVSSWSAPVTFSTVVSDDMCQIQLLAMDTYGDGWSGSNITITDVESGMVIGTYTLTSDAGQEMQTFVIDVPNNRDIQFTWTSNSEWDSEAIYAAYDINEAEIFSGSGGFATPITWQVDCKVIPWRAPSDFAATEVGPHSAKLSWTENSTTPATSWVIAYKEEGAQDSITVTVDANPYVLEGLTPNVTYTVKVRPATDEVEKWSDEISFTTFFPVPTGLAAEAAATTAEITWNNDDNAKDFTLRYAECAIPMWYKYDNGEFGTNIGLGEEGNVFWWGVMFPAGTYSGNTLSKVSVYDVAAMTGTVTIYNDDSTTAPTTQIAQKDITLTGVEDFVELDFDNLAIDNTKNVWVVVYNGSGAAYCAAAAIEEVDNPNGRFVSFDGTEWLDIANAGLPGYTWMLRAEIGDDTSSAEWTVVEGVTSPTELADLKPETTYTVQVKANYEDGESEWASTTFTTLESFPTPTNLAVSEVTNRTAVLSWNENGEATAWEICLNDDEANLVAADSNPFTLTGLTPETAYTAKVRAINGEKKSHWSAAASFTTDIACPAPTELAASDVTSSSATITWQGFADSYNLAYREYIASGDVVTDFDDSSLGEWTTIDADGDGLGWILGSTVGGVYLQEGGSLAGAGNGGSADLVTSGSYSNVQGVGALTPDNYLVSPRVTLGGTITFYACAQDASYSAEHFGVAVSTTSNSNPAAFTMVEEWTMNSDGTGSQSSRRKAQGTWGLFTVDLSAYAGQEGYVAIRHFNCTDQFLLNVDDITITQPSVEEKPWTEVANATSPYTIEGLEAERKYEVWVQGVYADGTSQWATTTFTTPEDNPVPTNIVADLVADGATLTWEGSGDSYKVRYRTAEDIECYFFDDFSQGLYQWTLLCNGEEGPYASYDYPGFVPDGENYISSYSWSNEIGAIAADNWLISPVVDLKGILDFYTYTSEYGDEYEVLLSTTGNAPEDFTTVLKEMGPNEDTTGLIECTFDLNEYAGQKGYIAIHHVFTDGFQFAIGGFGIYGENYTPAGEWTEIAVEDATAVISDLATNNGYEYQVQSIKGGVASEWSDTQEFALLTLDSYADNNSLLNNNSGRQAHVTLTNRTLKAGGAWNTLVLPFDLSQEEVAASALAGADARFLEGITVNSETSVTMDFSAQGAYDKYGLVGGYPWLVKWDTGSDIVNPAFANVTITSQRYELAYEDATGYGVTFNPTYELVNFTEDDPTKAFVGDENKIYYPLAGAKVGAFRGYFTLKGFDLSESNGVKIFTNLDGDDATGIVNVETIDNSDWYDLSGRKLAGKPSMKGIYVNGGRKVTVK